MRANVLTEFASLLNVARVREQNVECDGLVNLKYNKNPSAYSSDSWR